MGRTALIVAQPLDGGPLRRTRRGESGPAGPDGALRYSGAPEHRAPQALLDGIRLVVAQSGLLRP